MQVMSKSRDRDRDRMSELPEEVLLHILSFIPTRQAVQMSLLSKRWRHLWTRIPVLFFDEYEFPVDKTTAFHDFIDLVLFLRRENEGIRNFHFNARFVDGGHVRQWLIDVARHRNVEELVIDIVRIQDNIETELPHCLSSCLALRVLKIAVSIGCVLKLPNELNLSGLKSLYLRGITSVGGSLGKLISSCHFLEDLYLGDCQFDSLIISDNNLKKLSILYCVGSKIKVSAPSLRSFVYWPMFEQNCSLDNMVSLVDATFFLINKLWRLSEGMIAICEILGGIRYASSLTIYYCNNQHFCFPPELVERLPMFSNLAHLELSICLNKDHAEAIINILERSPNLKTLILNNLPLAPGEEDSCCWTPKEISPPFLLHLEKIKMKSCKSSALHLEFVKFLLRNTNSVKKITIIP